MFDASGLLVVLVSLSALALGFITLANNRKQISNRVFSLLSVCAGVYTLVNFAADHDHANALIWSRATFFISILMVLFLVLFANNFPKKILKRHTEIIFISISAIIGLVSWNPYFISITMALNSATVIPGPLYPLYLGYVALYLIIAGYAIRINFKNGSSVDKERMRYVMLGLGITTVLLLCTNLILPLLLGNNKLAALGSYFIIIFIAFSTLAIVRHRLFNVRVLVARSLAYVGLLISLGVMYSVAVFGITRIFFATSQSSVAQSATSAALAVVLAFTFQPLRSFFEKATDRIFYREHYDSQVVINNFSKILVSELDLERILKRSLQQICESVAIQYAQVVVYNNDRVYRIEHFGPLPKRLMVAPELARLNRPMIIADELGGGERKRILEDHGIRVSMTLRTSEDFVGYLLLGDKLSGDIYSTQDVNLLEIIGKELAVGILNAKAYAEIQEFNLTLQARVDHATNRLRVANRHLKELDHAKDEFISMASHQLRTPLTTIKGYLSMMLEGDAGPMSPAQKDFVGYAFGSSERMVNLISDLLNVSRLSAGRFLIQTKPTDMTQMIADEVRQLQSHATTKGIKLIFDKPTEPLPLVELDDNKTRQVVMNFIDNAIYYTKEGEVRVTLEQPPGLVRLEVTDTGIGVPDIAKKKLFSKFFRADNAQTVRPDGTGLGLYLAKRVVEDQGGTIIFSSVEGKGSTFGFELPLKPKPTSKTAKSAKSGIHHGRHT